MGDEAQTTSEERHTQSARKPFVTPNVYFLVVPFLLALVGVYGGDWTLFAGVFILLCVAMYATFGLLVVALIILAVKRNTRSRRLAEASLCLFFSCTVGALYLAGFVPQH